MISNVCKICNTELGYFKRVSDTAIAKHERFCASNHYSLYFDINNSLLREFVKFNIGPDFYYAAENTLQGSDIYVVKDMLRGNKFISIPIKFAYIDSLEKLKLLLMLV